MLFKCKHQLCIIYLFILAGRVLVKSQYRLNAYSVIIYNINYLNSNLYSLYAIMGVTKDSYLYSRYLPRRGDSTLVEKPL